MKYIFCCLLLTTMALTSLGQSSHRIPCTYFPINEGDSVCLDAEVNIAPEEVERLLEMGKKMSS